MAVREERVSGLWKGYSSFRDKEIMRSVFRYTVQVLHVLQ